MVGFYTGNLAFISCIFLSNYNDLNFYFCDLIMFLLLCRYAYVDSFSSSAVFLTSSCGCCTVSSQNGWSSLMVASHNGHVEVVDKLVQHGATVDLQAKVCVVPLTHKITI